MSDYCCSQTKVLVRSHIAYREHVFFVRYLQTFFLLAHHCTLINVFNCIQTIVMNIEYQNGLFYCGSICVISCFIFVLFIFILFFIIFLNFFFVLSLNTICEEWKRDLRNNIVLRAIWVLGSRTDTGTVQYVYL